VPMVRVKYDAIFLYNNLPPPPRMRVKYDDIKLDDFSGINLNAKLFFKMYFS